MAYVIKGDVNVTGNITVQSKNVGTNITTTGNSTVYLADTTGHVDLPLPSKSDVDYILKQLPLSQYGALNNNPVGVSGTFDGGSTVAYHSAMPVLLEKDGTLVFLRPGSNGSSINYYYTYLNHPDTSVVPNTTVRKYYNGASNHIVFFDSTAENTLLYQEVNSLTYHVVLTNGTLDNASHQEATFSGSLIPYRPISATLVDSYVYIIANYSSGYTGPLQVENHTSDTMAFFLYRIPVSQIQAGSISTVEQISGISGTTMYGAAFSGSGIRLADQWGSKQSDGSASFMKYPDDVGGVAYGFAALTYTETCLGKSYYSNGILYFNIDMNCYIVNQLARYDTRYTFVVQYNVNTKTYTHNLTSTPITVTGPINGAMTWNNPYSITSANTYGVGSNAADGNAFTMYTTSTGIQYAVKERYVLQDTYTVSRCQINGYTTRANALNYRNRSLTLLDSRVVYSDFASRAGDQLVGGIPVSTNKILFSGTGSYQGVNYTKYYRGVANIGTTRSYSYNSVDYGTITGYSPSIDRVPIGDANENQLLMGISYCDTAGNVTTYGCSFRENENLTAGYLFNPTTMTFDQTISITNATLVALKNSIISAAGLSVTNSRIGLYYSPLTSYCPSIACVSTVNSSGGGNIIMATVNATLSGGVVNTATLVSIFRNDVNTRINNLSSGQEMRIHSGLSCVKYSDFSYISVSHIPNVIVPGDSNEYSLCGVITGNTTISNTILSQSYHVTGFGSITAREYSYIPNYGFGYYLYSNTDKGTKLIFNYCGNTLAQYNANMANGTGTNTVILAQDVPSGFFLYFTEITPLFIGGQYFDVPITSIDLSTVKTNPGNTTFYVYVKLVLGTPSYVVSTTTLPETDTQMYIGTITTDGTKVSSLNIQKVSRLDTYRPSVTQIGSAFPVSTGNPTQTGTITW